MTSSQRDELVGIATMAPTGFVDLCIRIFKMMGTSIPLTTAMEDFITAASHMPAEIAAQHINAYAHVMTNAAFPQQVPTAWNHSTPCEYLLQLYDGCVYSKQPNNPCYN